MAISWGMMGAKYLIGTKAQVLRRMAHFAIRDQEALIDALTPPAWCTMDDYTTEQVRDCEDNIKDFKRVLKYLNQTS